MGATYNIELRKGVKVAMLFTPRLYLYKGREGVTFEFEIGNELSLHSFYCDIMYAAALNHWDLTHSADEECEYKRIEFHQYAASYPREFGKALIFAMQALSGKSVKEIAEEARKSQESQGNGQESQGAEQGATEVKKKSLRAWIMNLLRRG
jgi:hypothetical protein